MGELDLLTLGSVDVEPAVLQGDGMALDELPLGPVEGIHPVDDRTPPDVRALLPARGWRVVHEAARGDGGSDVAFAAPVDGGWATLHLARRPDGRSILSGDPGPVVPRPGRPARRAGLALRWDAARALTTLADPAATATGPASRLTITLTNDSDRRWAADPRDNGFVVAGLLDADGARIGQAYFSFAPLRHPLGDLGPHQSVDLPVHLDEGELVVPPGSYRLVAWLPSLDLRSDELALTLPLPAG